ncbi:MAG: hypothetical protein AB7U82_01120 [Blastocatellales bacterium]
MQVQLFGDPFNLQGNSQQLQGGYNPQQTGNPQAVGVAPRGDAPVFYRPDKNNPALYTSSGQPVNYEQYLAQGGRPDWGNVIYGPVPGMAAPRPAAQPVAPRGTAPAQKPAAQSVSQPVPQPRPVQQVDPTGLVGSAFGQYIGARPSPSNPGVAEFFRKDTNQALTADQLFAYASSLGYGQISSFEQLKANASAPEQDGMSGGVVDPNEALASAAGLANTSFDDYLKIVAGQTGLTETERQSIRDSLGIDVLESEVYAKPSKTTEQIYMDAFNVAGLADIKKQFQTIQEQINEKQRQLNERLATIGENPWLSEGSRIGRVAREKEYFEGTIKNLTEQANQLADLYNQGLTEVNNVVTRYTDDFNTTREIAAGKLAYLIQKAGEIEGQKQSEKLSGAYQYLPAYLTAKARAQEPKTIGTVETGVLQWDPAEGKFIQITQPQPKLTDDQREYQLATTQGYGGSFVDYKRDMANLKARASGYGSTLGTDLSNTIKLLQIEQLRRDLSGQKPLTGEALNKKVELETLADLSTKAVALGESIDWSGVGGAYQGSIKNFLAKNFGVGSQEENDLRALIGNITATLAKSRGGTSFTATEKALLEQYTPTINDSPMVLRSKFDQINEFIAASLNNLTGGQTPTQTTPAVDDIAAQFGGVPLN